MSGEPAASSDAADAAEITTRSRAFRTSLFIALGTGVSSMSFDFWYPFMPLYLLSIGATSNANALFWIAAATTVQGILRIATGPVWGILSDRLGRKAMFVRALVLSSPTIVIAAVIQAPWQIAFALGFQGLFSGFVPAAVALVSVSVPESEMGPSLSLVTGCQYLGTTIGPSAGAITAALVGYRAAIGMASVLPALSALGVMVFVPRDTVAATPRRERSQPAPQLEPFKPTLQFMVIVFFYFIIFSMSQLIRLATPIAIKNIDPHNVNDIVGAAFSLGGFASAISVLVIAPRFLKTGSQVGTLAAVSLLGGVSYMLLALAHTVPLYIAGFTLVTLMQAATIPITNTLIAANVPRSRRGTGFGWAASAQALGFIAGPVGAALFGAISLSAGFVVLGSILIVMAFVLKLSLKEPTMGDVVFDAGERTGAD